MPWRACRLVISGHEVSSVAEGLLAQLGLCRRTVLWRRLWLEIELRLHTFGRLNLHLEYHQAGREGIGGSIQRVMTCCRMMRSLETKRLQLCRPFSKFLYKPIVHVRRE